MLIENRDWLDRYGEDIRNRALVDPPEPWKPISTPLVGGVEDIGYAEDSDLLLVVSDSGRGVFDCMTGERVARDYTSQVPSWEEIIRLNAPGIGPLEGQTSRLAGIHGGGLPAVTFDQWSLEVITVAYAEQYVFLTKSTGPAKDSISFKIYETDTVLACGFSYTGNSFVIADGSHTIMIFARDRSLAEQQGI